MPEIMPTAIDENSKEYRKKVSDFLQIKAMHNLEGNPLDSYEHHLLFLHSTNKIDSEQCKKAFNLYLRDNKKIIDF